MNQLVSARPALLVKHPDPLLRAGVEAALRRHAAFETLVDGVDGPDLARHRIDVVIVDYDNAMHLACSVRPSGDGLAGARIVIVTTNDREADIRRAFEAGIHGYILLGGPLDELTDGVTAVAAGLRYVSRSVAQRMADSLTRTALTAREMQVLSLVAGGESNKSIARDLAIAAGTVKSHMTAIMSKLGATSRTQAASIASARGLVEQHAVRRPSGVQRHAGTVVACMTFPLELCTGLSWPMALYAPAVGNWAAIV
ncbi:response regulator transcription factor [Variovorax rhizosphaerae]|uniref:Response regulator transcription factor n=1 Tax=Variovorax rhizosphaerae TaxID=1836200 RepID=A0ABU8WL28_9BURK